MIQGLVGFVSGGAAGTSQVSNVFNITANLIFPASLPNQSDLDTLFFRGQITLDDYKVISRANGYYLGFITRDICTFTTPGENNELSLRQTTPPHYWTVVSSWTRGKQSFPTVDEAIEMYRLKVIDKRLAGYLLEQNGFYDPGLRESLFYKQYEIPGASDLIRFAVRDAFSPEIVTAFGYQNEFPAEILPWMEKQGYGQDIGIVRPAGVDVNGNPLPAGRATWSDLFWWSHWELPSPTQAYEMYFRLYRESDYGPSPESTISNEFTFRDLQLLLKTADYTPYWRERLATIARPPLTRVDVRRMYNLDLLDDAAVYHAYRANGYDDRNAKALLAFTQVEKRKYLYNKLGVSAKEQFIELFKLGLMNEDELRLKLHDILPENRDVNIVVNKAKLSMQMDSVKKTLKRIKDGFFLGLISEDMLPNALIQSGIKIERVPDMVKKWSDEREYQRKSTSVRELAKAYKEGIISESDFESRLFNLGYPGSQVGIIIRTNKREKELMELRHQKAILAEQQRVAKGIASEAQKAMDKQAKARQAKAKEIKATNEREAKKQLKEMERLLEDSLKIYSEKNLIAMFKAKTLQREDIVRILRLKGLTDISVKQWVETFLKEESEEGKQNENKEAETQQ